PLHLHRLRRLLGIWTTAPSDLAGALHEPFHGRAEVGQLAIEPGLLFFETALQGLIVGHGPSVCCGAGVDRPCCSISDAGASHKGKTRYATPLCNEGGCPCPCQAPMLKGH